MDLLLLSKILTVSGLLMDIVGVSLMAYDLLTYSRKPSIFQMKTEGLKRYRDEMISDHKSLAPEYSKEAIRELIDETNKKYEEGMKAIAEEKGDFVDYKFKVGLLGLKIIVIGFTLQAIGVIVS
jgi:hypothetical protein